MARRERKGEFATVLSRERKSAVPKIKIKRRPRGKPFQKGNTLSRPYWFAPGTSGNPGGRPKTREISQSARKQIGADVRKPPKIETEADLIVAAQLRKARKGDVGAAAFLADRAEGRPAVVINTGGSDNLALIVEGMRQMHAERFGAQIEDDDQSLLPAGDEQ
jgi:Family of unknown function (DUF5681)